MKTQRLNSHHLEDNLSKKCLIVLHSLQYIAEEPKSWLMMGCLESLEGDLKHLLKVSVESSRTHQTIWMINIQSTEQKIF